jgi:uncharacterized membrane protein YiaA
MELTVTTVVLLILIPLLVWRIYMRLKMLFARQESVMWRHWSSAVFFPIVLASAASSMLANPPALSMLGGAVVIGGWLGVYGLKKTRYEITERGYFFTAPVRVGMIICMLFLARVLQIAVEFYTNRQSETPHIIHHDQVMQHPATVITFGLLVGYFAVYSIGLIRWRLQQKPLPEQQ